jgi:putative intracellular protease/amidase
MKKLAILLFNDFETLDVFGPVEIFGRLKELYKIDFYSFEGGFVTSSHNVKVITEKLSDFSDEIDILLIPGGYGTRVEVDNSELISLLKNISQSADYVLTICTGTSLLAKTGLLNGINATTNKRAFDWVMTQGTEVNWIKKARWVVDEKYYTSAGVSAGMDMTLGFISDIHGLELARKVAYEIEYSWQENKEMDEFYLQELV